MGFLDGLGRFMSGKPVFEDDGQEQQQTTGQQVEQNLAKESRQDLSQTSVDSRGYKIIPQLELSHMKTSRNGNQMTTEVWITNASDEIIRIDYVRVANQKQTFNRELGPKQGYQFVIYRGQVQQNDSYRDAEIVYRLKRSDDLFKEKYYVEYSRESDGMYLIEEFHQDGPTRDI